MKRLLETVSKSQEDAHRDDTRIKNENIYEETQAIVDKIIYSTEFADDEHVATFEIGNTYLSESKTNALKHIVDYYGDTGKVVAIYEKLSWFSISHYTYNDVPANIEEYPTKDKKEPYMFAFVKYSNGCDELRNSSGRLETSYVNRLRSAQSDKERNDSDKLLKLVISQINDNRNNELVLFSIPHKYTVETKTLVLRQIIDAFADKADIVSITTVRDGPFDTYMYNDITNYFSMINEQFRSLFLFPFDDTHTFALHFRIRNVLEMSRGPVPRLSGFLSAKQMDLLSCKSESSKRTKTDDSDE